MKLIQQDILELVSKETQIPLETIKFWHSEFWWTIRDVITNPHKAKRGIFLTAFLTFRLPPERIFNYIHKIYNIPNKKEYFIRILKQTNLEDFIFSQKAYDKQHKPSITEKGKNRKEYVEITQLKYDNKFKKLNDNG